MNEDSGATKKKARNSARYDRGNTWKEEDFARSRIFIDSVSYPQLQLNQMYHREVHLTVPLVSFLLISLSTVLPLTITDAEPTSRRRRANKLIPGPTAPKGKLLSWEFTLSIVFFPGRKQYRRGSTSTGSADYSLCHTIGFSNRTHFQFVIREYFDLLDLWNFPRSRCSLWIVLRTSNAKGLQSSSPKQHDRGV